jgi:hypothetical protein
MTYSIGGLIEAADFNAILNSNTPNFNSIWSTGSGSSGYGQTAIGSVVVTAPVAAASWNSLITNMASTATHQGSTITALTPPTAGTEIDYLAAIATNMTTLNTNKLNCAAVGTDIISSGTRVAPWGSGQALPIVTSTATITFPSANQARYFFNAGGTIRISASLTGAGASPENTAWVNLCTDLGTLALPAVSSAQTIAGSAFTGLTKFGGGGTAPTVYIRNGFYNLGAPTILYRQFSNFSVYTNDYLEVSYAASGATVTIAVVFRDSASFFANTITGSLTVTAVARPPSTTNISNSWGTPTVSVTAPA